MEKQKNKDRKKEKNMKLQSLLHKMSTPYNKALTRPTLINRYRKIEEG